MRRFHPDGALALVLDFPAKTVAFYRADGPTDIDVSAAPDAAAEFRFAIRVTNEVTGSHDIRQRRFFDAAGVELSKEGRPYV